MSTSKVAQTNERLQRTRPLLVLGAAWLSASTSCGESTDASTHEAPVRLGILAAFTGEDAELAESSAFSMELALEQINALGGVLPRRLVEMVRGDDRYDSVHGRNEAKRLIDEEGVVAIVGPETSSVALEVLKHTVPAQVPVVSCCATSVRLSGASGEAHQGFFFRTIPEDSAQAKALARAADECGACTALAIFHLDDDYGNPLARALRNAFEAQPISGEVVYDAPYDDAASSYRELVLEAAATDADCVVIAGFAADAARVRRDWERYAGRDVRWLASEGILDRAFVDALIDPTLAAGFVITGPEFAPNTPAYRSFARNFAAHYGFEPGPYNAQVYDAAALLLLAIAKAGSTDGEAIRDALFEVAGPDPGDEKPVSSLAEAMALLSEGRGIDYEGASGSVDFDELGNVRGEYDVFTFAEDGTPTQVGLVQEGVPLSCPPAP